jgi:hypothetical protein
VLLHNSAPLYALFKVLCIQNEEDSFTASYKEIETAAETVANCQITFYQCEFYKLKKLKTILCVFKVNHFSACFQKERL